MVTRGLRAADYGTHVFFKVLVKQKTFRKGDCQSVEALEHLCFLR